MSTDTCQAEQEMPKYKCHKVVHALQIEKIDHVNTPTIDGGTIIHPVEEGFAPFWVDNHYLAKHNPQEGGYYVVYPDGYKSFSPKEAFEGGYISLEKAKELILQAIGEASMCWSKIDAAGVFDSDKAALIAKKILNL